MADTAAALFDRLITIVQTLRSPDGCPWDRTQTLDSLRPFLLEETYEALDAIDGGDGRAISEELGDLLFEVVFLARIGTESGRFTIADALESITAKLVRRHPHVFGDAPRLATAEEVPGRWEEMKAAERGGAAEPGSMLKGVPVSLPALLRAYELGSRAATVGFDWTGAGDVIAKVEEEVAELREVVTDPRGTDAVRAEEEMGDLLFALANLARKMGIEPESALRKANQKFVRRFTAMEAGLREAGSTLREATLQEMEAEWQRVKGDEKRRQERGTRNEE